MIDKVRIPVKRWKAYCNMVNTYGKMERKGVVILANHRIASGWWTNLKIHEYGYDISTSGPIRFRTSRDRFCMAYLTEGSGQFQCDSLTTHAFEGDLFILSPDRSATLLWDEDCGSECVWISFSCEIKPPFLLESIVHHLPVKQLFVNIRNQLHIPSSDGKVCALIYTLFLQLNDPVNNTLKKDQQYAIYAKSFIDENFADPIRIQHIADQLHIDRRYLTSLFHNEYGVPPQTYLMQVRLNRARNFLRIGYSVSDAAQMAGFTDLPNFFRQYRTMFGTTPGSERNAQSEISP